MTITTINRFLPLVIIIIFALFGVRALLGKGYFTSHDGWHQVVRLHYFDQSIKAGRFPPDYVRNLYNGYGYPLFIFNYHMPWFIAEPFMLLGINVFDSIKITYLAGYIASALSMYFLLRSEFGKLASVIGSVLYIWTPYRFSNIFVRGSIGEATIFIFLPLYFYALIRLTKKFDLKTIFLGALGFAALFLSHAIVAFLVILTSMIFILVLIARSKNKLKYFKSLMIMYFIGLLLCSYYLVPSIVLKKFTQFDERITATNNEGKFASLKEMIYSKWGYGFATPRQPDSMSFQVGIANWLVVLLVLGLTLISTFKPLRSPLITSMLVLFISSVYLITPHSIWFWKMTADYIFNIDFAWRLLTVTVFSSAFLSAVLIEKSKGKFKYILFILLIVIAIYTNRNHLNVNQYTNIPLSLFIDSEKTTNSYDEYLPKLAKGNELKDSNKGSQLDVNNENISNLTYSKSISTVQAKYQSDSAFETVFHIFYFPGWNLYINGIKKPFDVSDSGLIKLILPEGENSIDLMYEPTTIMKNTRIISISTLVIISFALLFLTKTNNKRAR